MRQKPIIEINDYSYILPKNSIAATPPTIRGQSRLLVLHKDSGELEVKNYADCIEYFEPGDVLVLNNTKVIKARLFAIGQDGKQHELVLLEKHGTKSDVHHHKVLYRGRLENGEVLMAGKTILKVEGRYEEGIALISSASDLEELAQKQGKVPLPPYIQRDATQEDEVRYQTEFAKYQGSVAAPTASLNMTNELIDTIAAKGVKVVYLTLHVGLGTFLPIRVDDITKHTMHSEWFSIPQKTCAEIQSAKQTGNKIIAVGTTVARTLEHAATDILKSHSDLAGEADIFIYPGYEFQIVDSLLTNFHAPKSTVLMLTAAFASWENLEPAYQYALQQKFRFLSYGDSMLIV